MLFSASPFIPRACNFWAVSNDDTSPSAPLLYQSTMLLYSSFDIEFSIVVISGVPFTIPGISLLYETNALMKPAVLAQSKPVVPKNGKSKPAIFRYCPANDFSALLPIFFIDSICCHDQIRPRPPIKGPINMFEPNKNEFDRLSSFSLNPDVVFIALYNLLFTSIPNADNSLISSSTLAFNASLVNILVLDAKVWEYLLRLSFSILKYFCLFSSFNKFNTS